MKWAVAVLILAIGCGLFLIPGVFTTPGSDNVDESASGTDDIENLMSELLGTSVADERPSEESAGLAQTANAGTPSGNAAVGVADLGHGTESEEIDPAPDYETVFPGTNVQRLDLVITPEDWESLLEQASSSQSGMVGGFDGREALLPDGVSLTEPPQAGADPDEMAAMADRMAVMFAGACDGCEAGDAMVVSLGGREVSGTCVEQNGALVFQPSDGAMPGPGSAPAGRMGGPTEQPTGDEGVTDDGAEAEGMVIPERGMFGGGMMEGGPGAPASTADATMTYVSCSVIYDGIVWEHVGIRFKGNSTLLATSRSDSWKYPLHLDFNEFEDLYPETMDQTFFGFDDLSLSNGASDSSLLRDYIPAEIFRSFGVPVPEVAYYQVYLDIGEGPVYLGLYALTETPDDPMLDSLFGDSDGNLYKPQGSGATWTTFDEASFEKKSNEKDADWSDIQGVFEALHADREDAAAWRADLEAVFDVDGFLRWLAINQLLGNWDAYGQMAQNYYLYTSSSDGLVHWIPWDHNQSFSDNMPRGETTVNLSTVTEQWPLISYLIDDPVYFDVYASYVAEALKTVFETDAVQTLIRETFDAIAPSFTDENGELSPHSFINSVTVAENAMEEIVAMTASAVEEAEVFLAECGYVEQSVIISEIHYNPSPEQGSDGDYEFIELANRGESLADLSGWRCDDGVEFTFPDGTVLGPNERLVVAANAACYQDLDCIILEWESGKLANEGEAIRFVDEDGFWIDLVSYDDGAPWPEDADHAGSSLVLPDLTRPNHLSDAWIASSSVGGTPGS